MGSPRGRLVPALHLFGLVYPAYCKYLTWLVHTDVNIWVRQCGHNTLDNRSKLNADLLAIRLGFLTLVIAVLHMLLF